MTEGNLPFSAVARFPMGVRLYLERLQSATTEHTPEEQQLLAANAHLAAALYYTQSGLPFGMEGSKA
jgi:hypothetical protein